MSTVHTMVQETTAMPALQLGGRDPINDAVDTTIVFDPAKHLDFKPPEKVWTMQDIGLPENTGVSSVAVSEPFKLFTEEAIGHMRAEVLSKDVLEKCQYSSNLAKAQLRGYAAR